MYLDNVKKLLEPEFWPKWTITDIRSAPSHFFQTKLQGKNLAEVMIFEVWYFIDDKDQKILRQPRNEVDWAIRIIRN